MARSPKDDPRYSEIANNTWKYRADATENCTLGAVNERSQPSISPNSAMTDNSIYGNGNFGNDVYLNKSPFNVPTGDTAGPTEEKIPFNNGPRTNQTYGNAVLNLGNGQLVRVFYDENNQQLIFPMSSGQYELFNHNQGVRDSPLQSAQPSHLFTLNHDYPAQSPAFHDNNTSHAQDSPTPNFLDDFLGILEPNSTGTYSPFGHNYPLNHPDASNLNILPNSPILDTKNMSVKTESSPKRNENSPLADTSNKKRIVAEVKPMRPSYSDVLAKNKKDNLQAEISRKVKPQNVEAKPLSSKASTKTEKPANNIKHDESKLKSEKKQTISSGSESGDINTDDNDKPKPSKKLKNKRNNSRKWSTNEDYIQESHSQFVFIEDQEKPTKKEKKANKSKNSDKSSILEDDSKLDEDDISIYQEGQTESAKSKKKKDRPFKITKAAQDKKKTMQCKFRRNKPGYLGLVQNYAERWGGQSWKALVWLFYLVSDICGMSLHLSFDLCTSVFTQTYVSSQAVWRGSREWCARLASHKYLVYIDRKLGHTRFGVWRRLKCFNKDPETDANGDKLNSNIPLPSTGEEAMKRLLACKGKDPYSILGVSVTCSDEEIKRYYRRQAFLVHPDKNQQPGAEEAFKILQHAFDLIGEPERREEYSRRTLESKHAEAAWSELSDLLAQLHDKMEFAANTIRCTNCGRRHKRVLTDRPCYAARYCAQCKIRHSAKEGDIWSESSMLGLLVMYYACMDGAVYQITQWASCQKKNLKQLRPDCHAVQYRIVLGNKAAFNEPPRPHAPQDPNLEEFLNKLINKSGVPATGGGAAPPDVDASKRRNKKTKP